MNREEGWHDWMWGAPQRHWIIQIWRLEWDAPITLAREEMHYAANVCGLYWRLTGIGKIQAGEAAWRR